MPYLTHTTNTEKKSILKRFWVFIIPILLLPFLTTAAETPSTFDYDTYFTSKTMRLDYFHTGNASEEHFSTDRILSDGNWPGSKTQLVDNSNLGQYFFEVIDKSKDVTIYSRGFASIYGEWETTAEAKKQWGTFHESLRFPWPKKPINIILKKRDAKNQFTKIWTIEIDPASRQVNPSDFISTYPVFTILENGPSDKKVDIVILGDGYSNNEMEKFKKDATRLTDAFFKIEPFNSRKSDFNVRAVGTPAETSGVNRPHFGIYKRTPLSIHYSTFDSERYALSYDNRKIRDVASSVPYDFMFILINERNYGGGGIYQLYASVASDNDFSDYIFVHEFGHHFAALSDEYYTSQIAYELNEKINVEPWESNITALLDKNGNFDVNNLKWKDMVKPNTPLPTPWDKQTFDTFSVSIQKERQILRDTHAKEEEMEALFQKERKAEAQMFSKMKYNNTVGAFEGAGYYANGMYRPSVDCIMFTRNIHFCPVCQHAINRVIDQYTR